MVVWVKSDPENGLSSLCVHSSDSLDVRMQSHIGCMSLNFPSVLLNCLFILPVWRMQTHNDYICLALFVFKCALNIYVRENVLSNWSHLFGFHYRAFWLIKLPACRDAKLHEQNQRGVKPHWNISNKQFISNSGLKKHLPRHCGERSH